MKRIYYIPLGILALVFIFAVYKSEMSRITELNSGIYSKSELNSDPFQDTIVVKETLDDNRKIDFSKEQENSTEVMSLNDQSKATSEICLNEKREAERLIAQMKNNLDILQKNRSYGYSQNFIIYSAKWLRDARSFQLNNSSYSCIDNDIFQNIKTNYVIIGREIAREKSDKPYMQYAREQMEISIKRIYASRNH